MDAAAPRARAPNHARGASHDRYHHRHQPQPGLDRHATGASLHRPRRARLRRRRPRARPGLLVAVFGGGSEPDITGAALLALGTGFALLAAGSRSTSSRSGGRSRPASVPASPARRCWRPHRVIGRSRSPARAGPAPLVALVGWLVGGARRSLHSRARRAVLYPAPPALLVVAVGGAVETVREATESDPHPPACTYAVNGHRLYLHCTVPAPTRRCCSARPRRADDELGVGAAGGVVDDPRLRLRLCRRGLERPGARSAADGHATGLADPPAPPRRRRHRAAMTSLAGHSSAAPMPSSTPRGTPGRRRRRPDRRLHAVPVRPARLSGLLRVWRRASASCPRSPARASPGSRSARAPPASPRSGARTLARSRLRPAVPQGDRDRVPDAADGVHQAKALTSLGARPLAVLRPTSARSEGGPPLRRDSCGYRSAARRWWRTARRTRHCSRTGGTRRMSSAAITDVVDAVRADDTSRCHPAPRGAGAGNAGSCSAAHAARTGAGRGRRIDVERPPLLRQAPDPGPAVTSARAN